MFGNINYTYGEYRAKYDKNGKVVYACITLYDLNNAEVYDKTLYEDKFWILSADTSKVYHFTPDGKFFLESKSCSPSKNGDYRIDRSYFYRPNGQVWFLSVGYFKNDRCVDIKHVMY